MNLCIDIDGTLTDPYYWLPRANKHFGTAVAPADVTSYEFDDVLGVPAGSYRWFYQLYGKLIHKEAEIRFGVREILQKLAEEHNIHYVTAREEIMREVTEEWLSEHDLPCDTLSLLGTPNKVWKAKQLESDFFIEDSYDNAIQLAQAGFQVLLIDCTYNRGELPENVLRVKNWHEISKLIDHQMEKAADAAFTEEMLPA